MEYRRAFIPGGSYFFTLVTEKRRPIFDTVATIDVLRNAFRIVRTAHPFEIVAIVIMPDHLHCIWTLPPGDADYALRWRLIKSWFTRHCNPVLRLEPDSSRVRKQQQAIWQHRYWEHVLRDETDFRKHVEYIHYNPVKHGYATAPVDWPYSSFRRFVESGSYSKDWGRSEMVFEGVGRE